MTHLDIFSFLVQSWIFAKKSTFLIILYKILTCVLDGVFNFNDGRSWLAFGSCEKSILKEKKHTIIFSTLLFHIYQEISKYDTKLTFFIYENVIYTLSLYKLMHKKFFIYLLISFTFSLNILRLL